VKHYFLPRDKIVYTYVISKTEMENGKKKVKVTDFLSFYSLPSHVMGNPKHDMLYVDYLTTLGLLLLLQLRHHCFLPGTHQECLDFGQEGEL
jgi:hypothetical protein